MTLLTRGKKDITFQIPDDTDDSYAQYKSAVKHIAADRKDKDALAEKLSSKKFDGECCSPFGVCVPGSLAGRPASFIAPLAEPATWESDGLASILVHLRLSQCVRNLAFCSTPSLPVCAAVVYDMNGREAEEAEMVLGAMGDVGQYIFCSSAGVYLKSHQMPHHEVDAVDPKSRHKVSPHVLRLWRILEACRTPWSQNTWTCRMATW